MHHSLRALCLLVPERTEQRRVRVTEVRVIWVPQWRAGAAGTCLPQARAHAHLAQVWSDVQIAGTPGGCFYCCPAPHRRLRLVPVWAQVSHVRYLHHSAGPGSSFYMSYGGGLVNLVPPDGACAFLTVSFALLACKPCPKRTSAVCLCACCVPWGSALRDTYFLLSFLQLIVR